MVPHCVRSVRGGATAGLLDEPVGIAVNDKDEIIVADTWNRRVQVFGNDGTFLREWSIEPAWKGTSLANKPYVAVAPNGNVYITDPEGYRILATDFRNTTVHERTIWYGYELLQHTEWVDRFRRW